MEKKSNGKWIALMVLVMAQIGTSGDNAVLSVATSALITSLGAAMSDIQLANIVYSLCAGCLMIVGGMVGLIIGWKKNFRIGALLCAAGELIVATSGSIEVFTWGGRLLVGIGASLMIPSVLGLIPALYKGKERAVAFGAIGAATGIAACAGPIAAGLLIDSFSWRIAFGFMAAYFALVLVGSSFIGEVEKPANKVRFDYVGTIGAIAGLSMMIIGISKITVWGLIAPIAAPFTIFGISPALPLAAVGVIILYFLVGMEKKIEEKHGSCLIPSAFFTTPQVRNGLYLTAMLFLCFGGSAFLIITYMQLAVGMSAVSTGLAMAAMAFPMILGSLGIPKYLPDASPKNICRTGIVVAAVSTIPMAMSLQVDGVNFLMYVGLALFGAGQGLVASQSANVIAMAVSNRDAQQSSGIQTATRNVGQAIGVAILGVVMLFSLTGNIQGKVQENTEISTSAKNFIMEQKSIAFVSNAQFEGLMKDKVESPAELEKLVAINAETRMDSTKLGIYVMGALIAVFLLGTRNLPGATKE
ncbi:MFS transporter [Clostridium sp.]|uniref:MFS transporter n=1 Tax=Clostridium sp. TaxID=1506 RepID=UPI002FC72466